MKTHTFHLELITPCFCAGAEPAQAEIRAPSVRGKLRWWFRVLGGTPSQEAAVFGSAAGSVGGSSAIRVRIDNVNTPCQWEPPRFSGISNTGYILYFAKASQKGARWQSDGALPPGTSFELQLAWHRGIAEDLRALFDLSLDAFLLLGSLGLRSTRGLGCFDTKEKPFTDDAFRSLKSAIQRRDPGFLTDYGEYRGGQDALLEALGGQLRGLRKDFSAGPPGRSEPTPLGSSNPRQSSAVYLRPVRLGGTEFRIVVFEAPASKVLGRESRRRAPRLGGGVPRPLDAPRGRSRPRQGFHR